MEDEQPAHRVEAQKVTESLTTFRSVSNGNGVSVRHGKLSEG